METHLEKKTELDINLNIFPTLKRKIRSKYVVNAIVSTLSLIIFFSCGEKLEEPDPCFRLQSEEVVVNQQVTFEACDVANKYVFNAGGPVEGGSEQITVDAGTQVRPKFNVTYLIPGIYTATLQVANTLDGESKNAINSIEVTVTDPNNEVRRFESFSLPISVRTTITDTAIYVLVDYDMTEDNLKNQVPIYDVHNSILVEIDGKQQYSDSSKVDFSFSDPVYYTLTSDDGASTSVPVIFKRRDPKTNPKIFRVVFRSGVNPFFAGIDNDENKINVSIPESVDLSSLKIEIEMEDKEGGKVKNSDGNYLQRTEDFIWYETADFTDARIYSGVAQDTTVQKEYTVNIIQ